MHTMPPPTPPTPPPPTRSRFRRWLPWIVTGVAATITVGALMDDPDADTNSVAAPAVGTVDAPNDPVVVPGTEPAATTTAPPVPSPTLSDVEIARLAAEVTWVDLDASDRYAICNGYQLFGAELTRALIPADLDVHSADALMRIIEREC